MKVLIVLAVVGAAVAIIVSSLGSTLGDAEYQHQETGVTGALEKGAVSEADQVIAVWRLPRGSYNRKDREELLVGSLAPGDLFEVLMHVREDAVLWVKVRAQADPDLEGWIRSAPDDPVHATKRR